jgi:hypothetical protein
MDELKRVLWSQFGAAIDAVEAAINACPEHVWGRRWLKPEFWYTAYHTLFWLDYYLSDSPEGFVPPAPYNLDEMDPRGLLPDRVYAKAEMLEYLEHDRAKARARIAGLTEDEMRRIWPHPRMKFSVLEFLLYTMRHTQHHAAQLNMHLRQQIDDAPRWVSQAKS